MRSMKVENKNENLTNGRSVEKQILVVFSKTITIVLILMFAAVFYASIFAPQSMAKFTGSLGMKNASLYYSTVQYNRDKDINSLYIVINKSIELKKYKNIEKYCEKLFEKQDYYDFIAYVETKNINDVTNGNSSSIDKINLMISLSNEDMYLKNKYVDALIHRNKVQQAFEFAKNDLQTLDSELTLQSRLHWCYSNLFLLNDLHFLDESQLILIENYVKNAYNLYNSTNFDDLSGIDSFNYVVLGNTLKRSLNDILKLQDKNIVFDNLSYDEIKNMIKVLNGVGE